MDFEKLTDEDLQKAWEKASSEFPDLPALRDLHFMRYLQEKWNLPYSKRKDLEPQLTEHIREKMAYWMKKMRGSQAL
jgi:hypothetical protein